MQIPHTNQNLYTKHDDIQGSLTDNVRNRYVEVTEGNESATLAVPLLSR